MINQGEPIWNEPAEQGALGCALMDGNLVPQLSAELFYDIRHQALVGVMQSMFQQGKVINHATVSAHLFSVGQSADVGGQDYVSGLPDKSPSPAQFGLFMEDLLDFALRRKQAIEAERLTVVARDMSKTALEHQDEAETRILKLRPDGATTRPSNGQILGEINHDIEEASKNPGAIRDLPTGITDLDWLLWGLKPGQLIVIGGRPGEGKSALMLQIASNVASAGKPAGYFSLEMGAKELLFRLQCTRAKVESSLAQSGRFSATERDRLLAASKTLSKLPLLIEDRGVESLAKIIPRARQMIKQHGVKLLVIDYLQLLQSSNRKVGRYEAITEVSAALKRYARDLGLPIIVGSQFNRDVEKEGRRPRLSDLRDSGSIEQDADVVLLIHHKPEEETRLGVAVELLVPKHRGGRTGQVSLIFDKQFTTFIGRSPISGGPCRNTEVRQTPGDAENEA